MSFYDTETNVQEYIKIAEGYDGAALIEVLREYLPDGSSVLELGMGPGVDLDILRKHYEAQGSDASRVFLDLYRKKHPEIELLELDALTLRTDRKFDGVYSNKVLHHLKVDELRQSLDLQKKLLKPGGILMHAFWYGEKEEFMHGMRFQYYTEASLQELVGPEYEIIRLEKYKEMEADDSLLLVLRFR